MKKIFKGPIHSLAIKSINITENSFELKTSSVTLKKDALFYETIFNKFINFDYNTVLASKEEANDYLIHTVNHNKDNLDDLNPTHISIPYFNEDELTLQKSINKKEFKELKKQYRKN